MMRHNKILIATLLLIFLPAFTHNLLPLAHAAPVFVVSLDAHSIGPTDILVQTSYTPNSTFTVSAIINATGANPISGVWAWQFSIFYDPTVLVAQADPSPSSLYPDGPGNTVQLGAQTIGCVPVGSCNWSGAVTASPPRAIAPTSTGNPGEIAQAFTFIGGSPITINQRTVLASVSFELLKKATTTLTVGKVSLVDQTGTSLPVTILLGAPATSTALVSDQKIKYEDGNSNGVWDQGEPVIYDTNNDGNHRTERLISGRPIFVFDPVSGTSSELPLVSDPKLQFVDSDGNGHWDTGETITYDSNANGLYDPGESVIAGSPITENILNNPPVASFTSTHIVTSYTFTDTSTDADTGDTIAYQIWDFGDKSPIVNTTSTTVTHDYGFLGSRGGPGFYNVTLRVVDNQGDTGTARDARGAVIVNNAPQHTFRSLGLVEVGPTASFTSSPTSGITTTTSVSFDGSLSSYPDEPVVSGTTPAGGTVLTRTSAGDSICLATIGIPCPLGYVDSNGNGVFDIGIDTIVRDTSGTGTCTTGACDILAGPNITPSGQTVATDGKISWYDSNGDGSVSSGESIIYDTNGNGVYDGVKIYAWDFGDGNTGSGKTTSHTFTTAGSFTVTFTVTDNLGKTASTTVGLTVAVPVHSPPTVVVTPPTTLIAGSTVSIQLSAIASSGSITTIKVDWGDGTVDTVSASATSASHTYTNAGSYTITVSATDDSGSTTNKPLAVTVAAASPSFPLIYLVPIPVVAIIAIAILALRRRSKPPRHSSRTSVQSSVWRMRPVSMELWGYASVPRPTKP